MRIEGLCIDFPDIEGVSEKQIWYANRLRENYVMANYDRFLEISDIVDYSSMQRIKHGDGYDVDFDDESFRLEFSEVERICLYVKVAWIIIATLKELDVRFGGQDSCWGMD